MNWLYNYVQGFDNRKEAKKYAVTMLKKHFIQHTLYKNAFSEQCYYTFSDLVIYIPTMENFDDSNDQIEIDFENANSASKFLPWAENGVFESSCSTLQSNG